MKTIDKIKTHYAEQGGADGDTKLPIRLTLYEDSESWISAEPSFTGDESAGFEQYQSDMIDVGNWCQDEGIGLELVKFNQAKYLKWLSRVNEKDSRANRAKYLVYGGPEKITLAFNLAGVNMVNLNPGSIGWTVLSSGKITKGEIKDDHH